MTFVCLWPYNWNHLKCLCHTIVVITETNAKNQVITSSRNMFCLWKEFITLKNYFVSNKRRFGVSFTLDQSFSTIDFHTIDIFGHVFFYIRVILWIVGWILSPTIHVQDYSDEICVVVLAEGLLTVLTSLILYRLISKYWNIEHL